MTRTAHAPPESAATLDAAGEPEPERISGGHLVAKALRAEGIDTTFTLGDVPYERFAEVLGGNGEAVRDPTDIGPALLRARESGKPSLINVWVDPEAYAPGTMNQTMYK